MHGKGQESMLGSGQFLIQYLEEISAAEQMSISDKGKNVWSMASTQPTKSANRALHWTAPEAGIVKINTDASFLLHSGQGLGGAVARDHRGFVFISVARRLGQCNSIEEAEGFVPVWLLGLFGG